MACEYHKWQSFHQGLEKVTLPSGLQSITFGDYLNQSLEKMTLPSDLQSITFGADQMFNQTFENVTLPSALQTITFRLAFNQSLEKNGAAQRFADYHVWPGLQSELRDHDAAQRLEVHHVIVCKALGSAIFSLNSG